MAEYEDSGALDAFQPSRKFVYGAYVDEPLLMLSCSELAGGGRTETAYYYHQDRNFNVIAMTDDTGQVVDRYSYSAYGEIETLTNGGTKITANPYFFTGRRFDAELTIYYYRARYHDPALGRFLNRDPGAGAGDPDRMGAGGAAPEAAFVPMDQYIPSYTTNGCSSCGQQPSRSCPFSRPMTISGSVESEVQYADGMNLYTYVKSNPVNLLDPSGLKSIKDCPKDKRKPRPDYKAPVNGCGPADSNAALQAAIWALQKLGSVNFTPACNQHDRCYGRCNSDKGQCDRNFKDGMMAECLRNYAATSPWESIFTTFGPEKRLANCRAVAEAFYQAVSRGGGDAYWAAQEQACVCCE